MRAFFYEHQDLLAVGKPKAVAAMEYLVAAQLAVRKHPTSADSEERTRQASIGIRRVAVDFLQRSIPHSVLF